MPRITQTESGKAWEYALARKCADIFSAQSLLIVNSPLKKAQDSYNILSKLDQKKATAAASEAAVFLKRHDDRFLHATHITIQSDKAGVKGDVRDLIFSTQCGNIGISAKAQAQRTQTFKTV